MISDRACLTELVSSVLSSYSTASGYRLPSSCSRPLLDSALERVLVSSKDLLAHLATLIGVLPKGYDFKAISFDVGTSSRIADLGLRVLTDKQIAELAISPLLLIKVSEKVEEAVSDCWSDIRDRERIPQFGKKYKKFYL